MTTIQGETHGLPGMEYIPGAEQEPFDTMANAVSGFLKQGHMITIQSTVESWMLGFCNCIMNGNIASWYQYASAMYLIDHCTDRGGLVLRTGHLQDRRVEPLQAMMACDTLKLFSYCMNATSPRIVKQWVPYCQEAHYTVARCDVKCNAAVPRVSGRGGVFVGIGTLILMAVAYLQA